jgi:integrase/recombinase XerD
VRIKIQFLKNLRKKQHLSAQGDQNISMLIDRARREFIRGYFSTNDRAEKTKKAYISDMSQFQVFTGESFDISSLKNTDIESWAAQLKKDGYSPASIRRKIVVLKVFCSYWVRNAILKESPFLRIRIHFGRIVKLPRTLTDMEIQALLEQAQKNYADIQLTQNQNGTKGCVISQSSSRDYLKLRNRALLELLFATGIRVGEISGLNVRDFITSDASFKIHGKGGKERLAFVVDNVTRKILEEYLTARERIHTDNPALFVNAMGNRLSPQGIANVIHQLRRASGVERNVTPHMLRHTVATLLLRNGVDIRIVQEFLGHASITTTQRYTHVAKDHMIRELTKSHPSLSFRSSK